MGACNLTFNRIVIRNQKADSSHSDTDWLHLVWYVGGTDNPAIQSTTFPLLNTQGSFNLHTGDLIGPMTLSCGANDNDPIMAVYAITNLGSSDYSDQVNQAKQITDQIAQYVADTYLTAARMVLEAMAATRIPWIQAVTENVVDPNWQSFLNVVNSAIDSIFNNIVGPIMNSIVSEIQNILGAPNCNGEVLHDFVIFVPNDTNDGSLSRVYTGQQTNSACGEPPHTEVDLTLHRDVPLIGQFGPVVQPSASDNAESEFRNRADAATQEGYVGAFPNFYYGTNGQANVGGTIFIKSPCGQWMDVLWSDLGYPPLDNFALRMCATDVYATSHGFAGGFPNYFSAQHVSSVAAIPRGVLSSFTALKVQRQDRETSLPLTVLRPFAPWQQGVVTVCGTVLLNKGCAERRELPVTELPDLADIGALFRFVQDYAVANGFVGGFPTYDFVGNIGTLPGRPGVRSMWIVLLPASAAVWQDVVLYWNPA